MSACTTVAKRSVLGNILSKRNSQVLGWPKVEVPFSKRDVRVLFGGEGSRERALIAMDTCFPSRESPRSHAQQPPNEACWGLGARYKTETDGNGDDNAKDDDSDEGESDNAKRIA